MPRLCKGGEIRSVDDWFAHAPPKKGAEQWVDGRSAKELAKAWFPMPGNPQVPAELHLLLNSHEEPRDIILDRGEPERVTHFDKCGGEGRNADLVLWGHKACRKAIISIEAKADEPFGELAGAYVQRARKRNPRSRIPERFALLCQGLLQLDPEDEGAQALRYQLLTATAGALADARECEARVTILVVHEFFGRTKNDRLKVNEADLNKFVSLLSRGNVESVSPGILVGPFEVPGNEHFAATKHLFIGKCRRSV